MRYGIHESAGGNLRIVTLQVIGIIVICVGLLLEIAQIGSDFWLGSSIAVIGVIAYVWGRLYKPRRPPRP